MTRLEMQERIGTGPYLVKTDECEFSGRTVKMWLADAHDNEVCLAVGRVKGRHKVWTVDEDDEDRRVSEWADTIAFNDDTMQAICDALNALWEAAQ